MRMIKVGDKYLGLVDRQKDALRFLSPGETPSDDPQYIANDAKILAIYVGGRAVKLKTRADHTGDEHREG